MAVDRMKSVLKRVRVVKGTTAIRSLQLSGFLLVVLMLYATQHPAANIKSPSFLASRTGSYYKPSSLKPVVDDQLDELARRQLHFSTYKYSGLDDFVAKVSSLGRPSLQDKCLVFFDQLSQKQPEWSMQSDFSWNLNALDKSELLKFNRFKDEAQALEWYRSLILDSVAFANEMADSATIMRVFGKCFLNDDPARNMELFGSYVRRMLPHTQNVLPDFYFAGGKRVLRGSLPMYNETNILQDRTHSFHNNKQNVVDFMRSRTSGKGIVVNVDPGKERDLFGLLRVLRATNNQYPIQVFHRGTFDEEARTLVHYHATASPEALLNVTFTDHSGRILPNMDLIEYSKDKPFPKQTVWFVDLGPTIIPGLESKIRSTKELAIFYSSFAEVLYMDVSTVPLVSSERFFSAVEYTRTGAYFFKDRAVVDSHCYMVSAIVARLLPLTKSSIEPYFDIGRLTTKTMSNSFFVGWNRHADTNLFVLNKKQHFPTVVNALILLQWEPLLKQLSPRDPNPYWLSMAISGDELFEYNQWAAGAPGRMPANVRHPLEQPHATHRVCSSQVAHISSETELMWLGPSFRYCRLTNWENERDHSAFKNLADAVLENLFEEPVRLEAAIFPPPPPPLWEPMLPTSESAAKNSHAINERIKFDRALDPFTKSNSKESNWFHHGPCRGTEYCAYESFPSFTSNKGREYSLSLQFTSDEVEKYTYLGKLWLNLGVPVEIEERNRIAQQQREKEEAERQAKAHKEKMERLAAEQKKMVARERKAMAERERKERKEREKMAQEREWAEQDEKERKANEERERKFMEETQEKEGERALKDLPENIPGGEVQRRN